MNRVRVDLAVIALLVLVWVPGLRELAKVWQQVEYASHGFLVPLVALWAATAHRETLRQLPAESTRWGVGLLVGAVLGSLAAMALRNVSVIGLMAVATVVAGVAALRGPKWVSTLRFPLAYLLFCVPLPVAWVTPLIVQLQLIVSQAAVRVLQLAGVAIYREGNVLTLPGDVSLFVAEACSGITSLITLIPIGVFIAYFTESITWRRYVIVASVIPIALLGNGLRVVLTVLMSIEVSVEFATEGPLHEWAGVATYAIGCAGLLAVGQILRRLFPTRGPGSESAPGVATA